MKAIISILVFILGLYSATSQISSISEEFNLPASLSESSGIIYFNNKLITHNDSGGNNELYEVDLVTGLVTRTVTISNATNTDWEDISQDETFIYIGDIGNNSGSRTDLKIYKINKTDYLNSDTIPAETIMFSYSDQTDFTANLNNTEWDAEALVSFDTNNLIVFTKNWVDNITKGYLVSKTSGTYSVNPLSTTLATGGTITGGTYNAITGKLYLIGYNQLLQPFVWDCSNFNSTDIFSGTNTQTQLSSLGQEQAEAIAYISENSYLITSESFSVSVGPITVSDDAKLISFSTNDSTLSNTFFEKDNKVILYPNPVAHTLNVKSSELISIEIFDTRLTQLYKGNSPSIDMSGFSQGIYIVKLQLNSDKTIIQKVIKK